MVGVGIAVAAIGFAVLASQMKGMGFEALALIAIVWIMVVAFKAMTIALIGMTAGAPGVAVLLAVGGAIALIGLGIGLAAGGIALIVMAFKELFGIMAANTGAIPEIAMGMLVMATAVGILALSLAGLAFMGPLALGALGIVAARCSGNCEWLSALMDTSKIVALG